MKKNDLSQNETSYTATIDSFRNILRRNAIRFRNAEQLLDCICNEKERKCARIESTSLVAQFCANHDLLFRLAASAKDGLWIERDAGLPIRDVDRLRIHQAGFYEIQRWNRRTGILIDSTVELPHFPRLSFNMSTPFVDRSKTPSTYFVSRFPVLTADACLPWEQIFGDFKALRGRSGIALSNESLSSGALSVYKTDHCDALDRDEQWQEVSGTFLLSSSRTRSGSSSLVASYSGPGDSGMILFMIETFSNDTLHMSIWNCAGEWKPICREVLRMRNLPSSDRIQCYLNVGPDVVVGGIHDGPKIEISERVTMRTTNFGVRMHGHGPAIRDVLHCLVPAPSSLSTLYSGNCIG